MTYKAHGFALELTKVPTSGCTECWLNKLGRMANETTSRRHEGRDLPRCIRDAGGDEPHNDVSQKCSGGACSGYGCTRAQEQARSLDSALGDKPSHQMVDTE